MSDLTLNLGLGTKFDMGRENTRVTIFLLPNIILIFGRDYKKLNVPMIPMRVKYVVGYSVFNLAILAS